MADHKTLGVLRNLRIKRVAVVDMGANFDKKTGDGAHILLYKSAGLGSLHVDSTDWESDYEKANLSADQRNDLPDSAFAAVWTDSDGKKHRKLPIHDAGHLAAARGRIDQADIPADVKAAARRKIEAATNKEKPVKKSFIAKLLGLASEPDAAKRAEGAAEILKEFPEGDDKPVHKADDPMCKCDDCMAKRAPISEAEVQKRIDAGVATAVAKATGDLQKKFDAEVKKREEGEVREELRKFAHLSINLDEAVPEYLDLKKSAPKLYEKQIATLKAADAKLAKSALFGDIGSGRGAGENSAWAQLEAKAAEMVTKSANGLTKEQALDKVMMAPENNELVKRYRQEMQ